MLLPEPFCPFPSSSLGTSSALAAAPIDLYPTTTSAMPYRSLPASLLQLATLLCAYQQLSRQEDKCVFRVVLPPQLATSGTVMGYRLLDRAYVWMNRSHDDMLLSEFEKQVRCWLHSVACFRYRRLLVNYAVCRHMCLLCEADAQNRTGLFCRQNLWL